MTQQIPISHSRQTLPCFCFFVLFFFLKRSYWSKFHVNIITSSRVMAIFFCKGLTRNLEIGNTPIWILPNIWRLGQVRNSKFVTNVFNEILLHAAKYQIYSFYRFWVIKGKLAGWWKNYPLCFPLRGNSVCILSISAERFGCF